MTFKSTLRSGADAGQILTVGILGGLMGAAIGLLLLGWLILPLTTLGAGIWALVMARLLRRDLERNR